MLILQMTMIQYVWGGAEKYYLLNFNEVFK